MMRIGRIGRAAIDGVAHALLWVCLSELLSSTWVIPWLTEELASLFFIVPAVFGLVSAAVFALCVRGESRSWLLCLYSALFCLLTWGLALVNAVEWHVRVLPLREWGNGDGLLLVLALGMYMASSLGLRGLVWLLERLRRGSDEEA